MSIYTDHKGQQHDTSEMAIEWLQRALALAKRDNHQDNIDALEEEIKLRSNNG